MKIIQLIKIFSSITLLLILSVTLHSAIPSSAAVAPVKKLYLSWKNSEDAVAYEMEIMTKPYQPNESGPSQDIIYHTVYIFNPGVELDLTPFTIQQLDKTYFRVRPLDLDKNPLADFSEPLALSKGKLHPSKPQPTALFPANHPAPLYPTYSWIPVLGAEHYIVEITKGAPENPNGISPSTKQVRSYTIDAGFDCYDTHAYIEEDIYYWRVLALNKYYYPIGTYSDAIPFHVSLKPYTWAVFGDSITHGGGAISNPPSDVRFDYSSYLPYEVKNLGRSGDSIQTMVERFDSDVLPFQPKYLFILASGNSIRSGTKAEELINQFQILIHKCEQNEITPIFLTIPPINPDRIKRVLNNSSTEDWQQQTATVNAFLKKQPYVVDINSLLSDERGYLPIMYSQDGLHPDISGKKVMAAAVMAFLRTFDTKRAL
jgi:lysophospholipase L1-like esterase